ncbi:MAG: hypothetical protein IK031_04050 [Bacteroidales bacterium]|nr:hypothetical protein [Bacteroidales bacterium]
MKRIVILIAAAFLAAATAMAGNDPGTPELKSRKRLDPTLRLVLPVNAGVSTLLNSDAPATPLYRNFMFNIEPVGVRWSARGTPFELNVASRFNFLNFGNGHAFYAGVPVRASLRFAKRGRVYATAAGEYLIHGTMHNMPWRCALETGISYCGVGVFASYGVTPFFTTATGPGNTLSFGLVVGL